MCESVCMYKQGGTQSHTCAPSFARSSGSSADTVLLAAPVTAAPAAASPAAAAAAAAAPAGGDSRMITSSGPSSALLRERCLPGAGPAPLGPLLPLLGALPPERSPAQRKHAFGLLPVPCDVRLRA